MMFIPGIHCQESIHCRNSVTGELLGYIWFAFEATFESEISREPPTSKQEATHHRRIKGLWESLS
jgi:hypothetical protein